MVNIEICAFSYSGAVVAERAGAIRVELCDNAMDGGTTPSYGLIRKTRETIGIQLYPIIRPRGGHCFYDEDEFEIMLNDIKMCKELGCDGISIGVQRPDGRIDVERMKMVVEQAGPMGVTCHRAFDATPNPWEALEDVIACGCERILSSGQASAAPQALETLTQLVAQAGKRISIMPGAGVRSANLHLLKATGATEFHSSARMEVQTVLSHQNPNILDLGKNWTVDEEEIRKMVHAF